MRMNWNIRTFVAGRIRGWIAPLLVVPGSVLLLTACGGEEAVEPEPEVNRPEQPAEVARDEMGYRRGIMTWEDEPYTGLARGFHSDGGLQAEIPLKDGLRHGEVREYYPNGQMSMRAEFVEGRRHGERRYFDEEGNLTKLQQWRDDEVVESLEGDDLPGERGLNDE